MTMQFTCKPDRKNALLAIVAALVLAMPALAKATDGLPGPVAAWYEALRTDDREAIDGLLTENATIELRDLGIVQTKTEFMESLDQWAEANSGAEFLVRPAANDGASVFEVCYRFPSNDVLIRESFTIEEDRIAASVQEPAGETCEGF